MCNCNCNNAYNNNCQCKPDCTDNPCGCKTSSDDVVYQGAPLECTGIDTCDTLTDVIVKVDEYVCGDDIINHFLDIIVNNTQINQQFNEIVQEAITCDMIWACETTTTTTTIINPGCLFWSWESSGGLNESGLSYIGCDGIEVVIAPEDVINNSGTICVKGNTTPVWGPPPSKGAYILTTEGESCVPTTTTTTTTLALTYCYKAAVTGTCTIYWVDAQGNDVESDLPITDADYYVCAQLGSVTSGCSLGGSVVITGGDDLCTDYSDCEPTTTTTTTLP